MSLTIELQRYLNIRRNLGYSLTTTERVLKKYVFFLEERNESYLKNDLFFKWKKVFGQASLSTWSRRLGMVRLFALWLHSLDSAHEVPPQSLMPCHYRRKQPYIYSDDEVCRILQTASLLPSKNGFRAITFPVFFGLISVSGLRVSEAVSLNNVDVDLSNGVITVHDGKNKKERILPVTDCTKNHLKEYVRKRDRLLGYTPEAFFISEMSTRLTDYCARSNFAFICQVIGLRAEQRLYKNGVGPRIHDLRHTFAVRVMINWYKQGKNIDQEILKLITYMGHKKIEDTYWYIEAVPELLALASRRADSHIAKEGKL